MKALCNVLGGILILAAGYLTVLVAFKGAGPAEALAAVSFVIFGYLLLTSSSKKEIL